ncbi:MAG: hypothetical protein NTV05_16245 [Acidobacteria bacterium]|nr:hypothetical protein [Acidobacteriota bacterium]
MKVFTRWMLAVALSLVSASVAPAQGREGLPGVRNLPSDVAIGVPQRTVLYQNIVYYSWTVRVGPGEHDVIGLHRVVKERRSHQPADPAQAVMFFPGAPTYFKGLYLEPLISDVPARDRAIAIYLAANDIDVWGMDYRWALVPESTTDFLFMKDWGILRDVEDAQIALTIARQMRGSTSDPAGPLFVSGLSYGAQISYAVAANDTQRPRELRNVRGLIPLDYGVKFEGADYQAQSCAKLKELRQVIKSGTYNWDNRDMLAMGRLAIDQPLEVSPYDPGFDNYHFALGVAGWPEDAVIPWHFAGSLLDANGNPDALRFTEPRLWFDLLGNNESPYSPNRIDVEDATVNCGRRHPGVTYADHVGDITVPLFYVGAAGGFGHFGDYSTTLVASHDVTILIVQLLPDDQRAEDFGHVDLLTAVDAETLVWQPILNWIKAHK